MQDPWTDRLSDYLDGDLSTDERSALEQHLLACDACRATLAELRAVVLAARSLEPAPPAHDLWPDIAHAIETPAARAVVPLRRPRRRVSFTLPQLAAAAVTLMAVSGTAVWLLGSRPTGEEAVVGTLVHAAGEVPAVNRLVTSAPAPDPSYDTTVAELEQLLDENRANLDPATVEVLERSIAAIDRAIADSRAAIATDPANPQLHRQLENTMQKKIDVLRRATRVQRGA